MPEGRVDSPLFSLNSSKQAETSCILVLLMRWSDVSLIVILLRRREGKIAPNGVRNSKVTQNFVPAVTYSYLLLAHILLHCGADRSNPDLDEQRIAAEDSQRKTNGALAHHGSGDAHHDPYINIKPRLRKAS